jgi:predicted small secreted protein
MRVLIAKRRVMLALLLLGPAGAVQACNTVEGAGTDIKKAGQGLEDKAERNK